MGDPADAAPASIIAEFRQRFSLFQKITGHFGVDGPPERIPLFLAFLLAAANNPRPGGYCFVLDMSPGTTAIAALLTALSRLKADFPKLIEDSAALSGAVAKALACGKPQQLLRFRSPRIAELALARLGA